MPKRQPEVPLDDVYPPLCHVYNQHPILAYPKPWVLQVHGMQFVRVLMPVQEKFPPPRLHEQVPHLRALLKELLEARLLLTVAPRLAAQMPHRWRLGQGLWFS